MRILILGASGFIGAHMARSAAGRGHEVIALCRSGAFGDFTGKCLKWEFGAALTASEFEGVSSAIHLAHDFSGGEGAQLTFEETLSNVSKLREAGVKRQLFFSSYSAGEHATSLYGRTKWAIERALAGSDDIVIVRPGLVLGDGGLHGRIKKWARRLPIIPLPEGGTGVVPVIGIDSLCGQTMAILENADPGPELNLFEREPRTLRDIVLDAAAEAGRKPWIFPVSASLIAFGLRLASALKVPLPINADNLEGFIANQAASHESALRN